MQLTQTNYQSDQITKKQYRFDLLVSDKTINKTFNALEKNGFIPFILDSKEDVITKLKELVPTGSSIMNGASETLREVGFIDALKSGKHNWNNLHDGILAESNKSKQADLRRQSVLSDYYIGSAHAVTESGEILIASNTGSQLPHLVYTSANIVLVVGAQKIVPTLTEAFNRLNQYVIPLEDKRMNKAYGFGTTHSKTVILHKENPMMGRKVNIIFVKEKLGF